MRKLLLLLFLLPLAGHAYVDGDGGDSGPILLNKTLKTTSSNQRFIGNNEFVGGMQSTQMTTPVIESVVPIGTVGTTTYGYKLVATSGTLNTAASAEVTTATGNATLSDTDYNLITWVAVDGATGYKIYRTTGGSTTGLIGTVDDGATITFTDTGLTGDGTTPPTTNSDSFRLYNPAGTNYFGIGTDSTGNGIFTCSAAGCEYQFHGGSLSSLLASDPTCSAGQYKMWFNTTTSKLRKCENGIISDVSGGGGGGISTVGNCTVASCGVEGGQDVFPFIYEGTPNDFETSFLAVDPTADRTITFPDASGEVSLLGQTISASEIDSTIATQANLDAHISSTTDSHVKVVSADLSCSAGEYKTWFNTTTNKMKKCESGTITDVVGSTYAGGNVSIGGATGFFWDDTNKRLSVGNQSPISKLHVAGTLSIVDGTNPQREDIYNTYTDTSNYERAFIKWATNELQIGTEAAGTGTKRPMRFMGKYGDEVQTVTVADNGTGASPATFTLTPTSGDVRITCNDPDGCNATLDETGAMNGQMIGIVNVSANTVNFSDTAGVSELADAFAMAQWQTLSMKYISDRWVEFGRSPN